MSVSSAAIDAVLQAPPPAFSPQQACEIARATFGIQAAAARNLGSERDQAFLLTGTSGAGTAVLKVSNPAEDPAMLDMEATAALHAARCDPGLTIALPVTSPAKDAAAGPSGSDLARRRVRWMHDGNGYWVRAYDLLPGRARLDPLTLADHALTAWGETAARLGLALRGFIHPRAIRRLPWDVQHAASTRPMAQAIADPQARAAVLAVLDRYDASVAPRFGRLRAQVIHSDLTADNVLADENGLITGIVDFGDMTHTALLADLAAVLDSLCGGRGQEEMFRAARLVIDGYERRLPLEPIELELLGELWAARAAVTVAIGSWRAAAGLEDPAFAERFNDSALAMVDNLLSAGWARTCRLLGADPAGRTDSAGLAGQEVAGLRALEARRNAVFGPAMEPLSYADPIEMAGASGVWMTGTDGRRYLDMYNNVVCVGHAHPRVTSAVGRQWRALNTNLRYLHASAIELAERLIATCPPGLDTVLFVNSGSEANDLAWRLARSHTGNAGGLCTAFAYHGITAAMADFSPEVLPGARTPGHVQTWTPPDSYRGLHQDTAEFEAALHRLGGLGLAPAAVIFDGVLQSDGIYDLDPSYVRDLVTLTHEAGGLWVADEVQGGHGRTGESMWSFARFGIVPDFVTLGKPMGNGQPVGAVITRSELLERFARDSVFFSTFAGNQVSMTAAHAVLDVLADERVLPRTLAAGAALRTAVRAATADAGCVGDIRGAGLASAIEIVTDRTSRAPDRAAAAAIKDALRGRGVLVGTTGRNGNILKIRPPLAFTEDLVPAFTAALTASLADCQAGPA